MTDATVAALADLVGGRMIGDGERVISGLGDLRSAGPDRIGFVRSVHYHALAGTTKAGSPASTRAPSSRRRSRSARTRWSVGRASARAP